MKTFTWDESLSVGIPEIDQQHKQLIDQMNELTDAIQKNAVQEEINPILQFLEKYINQHFSLEESCMNKYKCPIAAENKTAHEHFIKKFQEIKEELTLKGPSLVLALKINKELLGWFMNHIKKIDPKLKRCI